MASSKRIGFFWGEEKITLVEFDKNIPQKVISSSLASKTNTASPFNSTLTEEIQITTILQKLLKENEIKEGSFFISFPMKEIILRSFIIPFVKPEEVGNVIKYEAKKYMPFDIQDMAYVYHLIPFMENKVKHLQVIFFATRKDTLARYDRIFKQVNIEIASCEPYMVSLSKALLFQKDIKPTDHFAFLTLDNETGCICFIDKGIPQFIREFAIIPPALAEEITVSDDAINLKIVNEVGNSFDFYLRQFNGERIEQMLVSSESIKPELLSYIESELKVKLTTFNPRVAGGLNVQGNSMDAIYAMGACVDSPIELYPEFNFLGEKKPKSKLNNDLMGILSFYKEIILLFFVCVAVLIGAHVFFQSRLKIVQDQYNKMASRQGDSLSITIDNIQSDTQDNINKLRAFKNIRTKSEVVNILLRLASHLPQGALLTDLNIRYTQDGDVVSLMTINMSGDVLTGDANEQIALVNQIFSDIKDDKELAKYVKNVNLQSLSRGMINSQEATVFNINCT